MKPRAFYNDNDPRVCAWVRELMADGLIMEGDVDERSITEIKPEELRGYTRIHLFCGIAGWERALQLADWPACRPVLTCSAPCQSFSCAGQGKGVNDPRHLWPEAFRLIRALKPECVVGEQVAAAIGHGWLDGICDDLEGEGYTTGAAVLAACSVGAPHIRQRLYWVGILNGTTAHKRGNDLGGRSGLQSADAMEMEKARKGICLQEDAAGKSLSAQADSRIEKGGRNSGPHQSVEARQSQIESARSDSIGEQSQSPIQERGSVPAEGEKEMAHLPLDKQTVSGVGQLHHERGSDSGSAGGHEESGDGGVVQSNGTGREPREQAAPAARHGSPIEPAGGAGGLGDTHEPGSQGRVIGGNGPGERIAGPAGLGFRDDYELIPCADGKQRRIESGSKPLVNGPARGVVPGGDPGVEEAQNSGEARVMRLRGYGNALCVPVAAQFIKAVMDL